MAQSAQSKILTLPRSITFDTATQYSEQLNKALLALCQQGQTEVIVDLAVVDDFDSSALAVLLQLRRDATKANCGIALRHMPPRLRELTKLYGVAELLPDAE